MYDSSHLYSEFKDFKMLYCPFPVLSKHTLYEHLRTSRFKSPIYKFYIRVTTVFSD
jgi:hypothetical protein